MAVEERTHRYVELDLLRTLAVLGMILYHLLYDLMTFYGWPIPLFSPGWVLFERSVASLFLLLVGISFAISWGRHRPRHEMLRHAYQKYLKRGLGLIGCGMLVSLVTYVIDPQTFVRFGILHLIGMSILLLPLFATFKEWNIILGCLLLLLAPSLHSMFVSSELFVPLGLTPSIFITVDYFPLIPWFGVVLIGYSIGRRFYVRHLSWRTSLFPKSDLSPVARTRRRDSRIPIPYLWPGRNALLLYLLHQPILLTFLFVFLGRPR